MAKHMIDGPALESLSLKLQQISTLFDAIDDEVVEEPRASVMCSIGLDIAKRVSDEIEALLADSRAEVAPLGEHAFPAMQEKAVGGMHHA